MPSTIRLTVPGTLRYRSIAVRVVAETARLVSGSLPRDPDDPLDTDVRHPFDTAIVSAFMEIFNNVAIHAYQGAGGGVIELALTPSRHQLVIELTDTGRAFALHEVAPLPTALDEANLPERGMGIHIARTMLDEMTYQPGPPNLWRLCKRMPANQVASGAGRS